MAGVEDPIDVFPAWAGVDLASLGLNSPLLVFPAWAGVDRC